jgi:hypothetical protein
MINTASITTKGNPLGKVLHHIRATLATKGKTDANFYNFSCSKFSVTNSLGNRLILIGAPQLLASAAGSIDTL